MAEVFRRIHCTAELSWMNQSDIGQYFRQFLFGCWVSNLLESITFQTRRFMKFEVIQGSFVETQLTT